MGSKGSYNVMTYLLRTEYILSRCSRGFLTVPVQIADYADKNVIIIDPLVLPRYEYEYLNMIACVLLMYR